MKLTVLGSGTSVPHPKRCSSGYWLETGHGSILLDCSPSVPHRMAQEGLDWGNLDAIWISHFHLDHCGGLAPLLFGMKHTSQTRHRTKPLRVWGGTGLRELFDAMNAAGNYRLTEQLFPVEIIEIEELEKFEILPGVDAVACRTPHTDDSHALHFRDASGTSIVFSSDTGFDKPLAAFANGVDLFLVECSFVRDKPVNKHLELAEAMYLVRKARPKRAMLSHFYEEWDEVDFAAEVARFEPFCEVIEAVDGLKLTI